MQAYQFSTRRGVLYVTEYNGHGLPASREPSVDPHTTYAWTRTTGRGSRPRGT